MMLEISTPALLFPTISLILLAYTNRFLGLAVSFASYMMTTKSRLSQVFEQIENLRRRIYLIRDMQLLGVGSLFCCTLCIHFPLHRIGSIWHRCLCGKPSLDARFACSFDR